MLKVFCNSLVFWACGYCLFSTFLYNENQGSNLFSSINLNIDFFFKKDKLEKEVKVLHVWRTWATDRVPNYSKIERNSEVYSNQEKEMGKKKGFWSIANEDWCEGSVSFTPSSANRKCEWKNQKGRRLSSSFLQSFAWVVGGWFSYLW